MKKHFWLCFMLVALSPGVALASEAGSYSFQDFLMSYGPALLLLAIWLIFLRKFRGGYMQKNDEHMKQIAESLERIAKALEKRSF